MSSDITSTPMPIIVQKFGGTSVGTIERIQHVARLVLKTQQEQNCSVVVVVSAMSGETNRLVELARKITPTPDSKEYDLLLASGEQVSVGLVSLAINTLAAREGLAPKAHPFIATTLGIRTDATYSKARIRDIQVESLFEKMNQGCIPVIAGFQGIDEWGNITTLGRGGSDTSAVAIAAALKQFQMLSYRSSNVDCEIYTDVDGVYTTDPRLCSQARKISQISHEEMMELATLGAKVLHPRSVELAAKHQVPLHVRSSFEPLDQRTEGTRVVSKAAHLEEVVVVGVAGQANQAKLTLQQVQDAPGVAAEVFGELSKDAVIVDVIVQDTSSEGKLTVSFTVEESDRLKSLQSLERLKNKNPRYASMKVIEDKGLAKVSIVGSGMANNPGVAARMFEYLAQQSINIRLITTSEIKVSCLILNSELPQAVRALHHGFGLDLA